jgi:hypothetical protein
MAVWCTLTAKHTPHHGHKKCSISDSLAGGEGFCTEESPGFDTENSNNECGGSDVSRFHTQ